MLKFGNFDEVLDFAILQEQAAQKFYSQMVLRVQDPAVQSFYRSLVTEEKAHENRLRALKGSAYALRAPDLKDLAESGYLDAMPIPADVSMREAVEYAIRKEKSAQQLYSVLASLIENEEMEQLFRHLAFQEMEHAKYFQKELAKCGG